MTSTCFVVAFGHGTDSEHSESPRDMAEALRNLVETACKAKGRRFSTKSSVSVAPGGVMFALADDEPDRAVELCQAVMAQLEHQATTHQALPPVCAAITHGSLRQVDVLGFSSNFEGWPAIAAARVVAKLEPGELAIEQSVWEFASVLRDCGDPKPIPGKAHDTPFQVRIHRRIQFPTTLRSMEPQTPAQDTPDSIQLPPYAELAQKARERIAALLQDPGAQTLRAAIMQQGQGQSAEDILVPTHATSLLTTLKRLHDATHTCLQKRTATQPQPIGPTKTVAMSIFSCLTGLAINHEELMSSGQAFNPWQHRLQRSLPLASEASVEVMVSSLGEHPARFRTLKDNTHPRWVGKDSITNDELETGLTHSDRLTGLQQRIWCAVMQVERPPESFGNHELQRLQAILSTRDEDKTHLYYITLPQTQDPGSQIDAALLDSLLQALPALRVFSFRNQHGTSLLCVDEYRLWARIEEFLNMVEAS